MNNEIKNGITPVEHGSYKNRLTGKIGEVVSINIDDTLVAGANKLDISINTAIRKALNEGKFPVVKNGGTYYYPCNVPNNDLVGSHRFIGVVWNNTSITVRYLTSSMFNGDTFSNIAITEKTISFDA